MHVRTYIRTYVHARTGGGSVRTCTCAREVAVGGGVCYNIAKLIIVALKDIALSFI